MRERQTVAGEAGAGSAPKGPAFDRMVDRRLLHDLLNHANSTLLSGALVCLAVGYAVWRTTGLDTVVYWVFAVMAITLVRMAFVPVMKRRLNDGSARATGHLYAALAFVGGTSWAFVVLFDDPAHGIGARLMILITLVGMPVASLSSNAFYRSVFYAFSTPLYLAMLYWSWFLLPELAIEFSLVATVYMGLVIVIANRYNGTLRRSLMRDIENEMLLHEVNSMNDKLHKLAYHDSLTGLSNRRSFEGTTSKLLTRRRDDEILVLMLIDMDKFKWINDTLGHAAGDAALVELSRRIDDNSRLRELVTYSQMSAARIGGDEFIALYHLQADTAIEPIAIRILGALMRPMHIDDREFQPGVSIGIAIAPRHGEDLDSLLGAADAAMYQAKQAGGGRFVIATASGDATPTTNAMADAHG